MAEKFRTSRLSPFRITVASKQYNKYQKRVHEQAVVEFEQRKNSKEQVPIIDLVFSLIPRL